MPTFSIDPVTLRDYPDDIERATAWVHELSAHSPDGDGERVSWLRMLGRLEEAEILARTCLQRNLDESEPVDGLPVDAVLPAARLAVVLHWQGRTQESEQLFNSALAALNFSPTDHRREVSKAFVLQHRGKLLLDLDRTSEALEDFTAALALRRQLDAPADQVRSSELAVQVALRALTR